MIDEHAYRQHRLILRMASVRSVFDTIVSALLALLLAVVLFRILI